MILICTIYSYTKKVQPPNKLILFYTEKLVKNERDINLTTTIPDRMG